MFFPPFPFLGFQGTNKSSISLTSYNVDYNKTREKARLKTKKEIPMNF